MKDDVLAVDNQTTDLFISEPISGTPFTMVKKDGLYFLTMGKYRLTEGMDYQQYDACVKVLSFTDWHLVLQLAHIVIMEFGNKEMGGNNE